MNLLRLFKLLSNELCFFSLLLLKVKLLLDPELPFTLMDLNVQLVDKNWQLISFFLFDSNFFDGLSILAILVVLPCNIGQVRMDASDLLSELFF